MKPSASSPAVPPQSSVSHRPAVAFWPVFVWLVVQMIALLVAGLRVPFSARFPTPEEQLAVHEMLVAQMVASALLFPILFRTVSTAIVVIAAAPLMVQLAGVLAALADFQRLAGACAYSTLWLIGLALWASALRSPKAKLYGVAGATVLVVGGAVVAYLGREFGAPMQPFDWARQGYLGPLVGGMALLEAGERTGTAWLFLGLFLLSGGVAAGVRWGRGRASPLQH